ncbi:alpha/beta-hydrolase family protein [Corynebacterium sp. A21]|uniref:alpha/beta-hydrolase family protein n=1 Tax=Corynebacterium sp. A21 TaxID=3457318 RepID=UPI003FD5A68C
MVTLIRSGALTLLGAVLAWSLTWWAFDSGPLSSSPELALTQASEVSAVRVYGDHRGIEDGEAARRTVTELRTAGGFDREILVVMLPTGSGWVDPEQVSALERWAGGDIATVSMRYSAAPSAVVYLLNPNRARESAAALLHEVGQHLAQLPELERPALIVQGLSLGAAAGRESLEELALPVPVAARLWQGAPGGAARPAPVDPCTVSAINADDPVAALNPGLLWDRGAGAVETLWALPGSDSREPGSGHRYLPVLPPAGCVAVVDRLGV